MGSSSRQILSRMGRRKIIFLLRYFAANLTLHFISFRIPQRGETSGEERAAGQTCSNAWCPICRSLTAAPLQLVHVCLQPTIYHVLLIQKLHSAPGQSLKPLAAWSDSKQVFILALRQEGRGGFFKSLNILSYFSIFFYRNKPSHC